MASPDREGAGKPQERNPIARINQAKVDHALRTKVLKMDDQQMENAFKEGPNGNFLQAFGKYSEEILSVPEKIKEREDDDTIKSIYVGKDKSQVAIIAPIIGNPLAHLVVFENRLMRVVRADEGLEETYADWMSHSIMFGNVSLNNEGRLSSKKTEVILKSLKDDNNGIDVYLKSEDPTDSHMVYKYMQQSLGIDNDVSKEIDEEYASYRDSKKQQSDADQNVHPLFTSNDPSSHQAA